MPRAETTVLPLPPHAGPSTSRSAPPSTRSSARPCRTRWRDNDLICPFVFRQCTGNDMLDNLWWQHVHIVTCSTNPASHLAPAAKIVCFDDHLLLWKLQNSLHTVANTTDSANSCLCSDLRREPEAGVPDRVRHQVQCQLLPQLSPGHLLYHHNICFSVLEFSL